jgi:hypothetical protein
MDGNLADSIPALLAALQKWHGGGAAKDDISLVALECSEPPYAPLLLPSML